MTSDHYAREMAVAHRAVLEAGAAIRDLYDRQAAETYTKADGSAVTDADLAADRIIRACITDAFPNDAILTEEGADDQGRLDVRRCWIVDPIDGTNQFVNRTGEFDVLVALVEDGVPVVGVMHQPTTGLTLGAVAGGGAWRDDGDGPRPLRFDPVPDGIAPRLMTSLWFGAPDNLAILNGISAALGGGEVAVTSLGITVRRMTAPQLVADALVGFRQDGNLAMAWEWDFAAADVIVHEAGGRVTNLRGERHRYNKPNPRNAGGIVLSVDPRTHDQVLTGLQPWLGEGPGDEGRA